jgi:LacI family transcriptional regulator
VKDELVERVQHAVTTLGYHPNAAARTLKTRKANAIGILVPDISNPYFMQIIKGIEDVMALDFSLLMASSDEDSNKEKKLLNVLSEDRIDCLVLATAGGNDEVIRTIDEKGIPVVLIDRLPESLANVMDSVVEDNFWSAYELAQSMINLGIKSLGIIHGPMSASTAYQRASGCMAAIRQHAPRLAVREYFGDFTLESGERAVEHFLQEDAPEAIIALNNLMAVGAISKLIKHGFVIGKDIVAGSYGAIENYLLFGSSLRYVEQEPRTLGKLTGRVVQRRLEDRHAEVVSHVVKQQLGITVK